jgi:hypothetical protein
MLRAGKPADAYQGGEAGPVKGQFASQECRQDREMNSAIGRRGLV